MTDAYRFRPGGTPLLVSMPHVGTEVPPEIGADWTEAARALPDNDWHVERLYDELIDELGAATLQAVHPRYVVDLNRPPDDHNLYPGQDTPGLVPLDTFAKDPIHRPGREPSAEQVADRVARYWRPYHQKLRAALDEIRAEHGVALLWEAHSIRSFVPRFVSEPLPDLNFGTGGGVTCAPDILAHVVAAAAASGFTSVVDGRFKGGYTTRHYGDPRHGVHAIQLELAQRSYLDEDRNHVWVEERAVTLRRTLRACLEAYLGH